jgi:hypothetical protein
MGFIDKIKTMFGNKSPELPSPFPPNEVKYVYIPEYEIDKLRRECKYWEDSAHRSWDKVPELERQIQTLKDEILNKDLAVDAWHKERMDLLKQCHAADNMLKLDVLHLSPDAPNVRVIERQVKEHAIIMYGRSGIQLIVGKQYGTWCITPNGIASLLEVFQIPVDELSKNDWPLKMSMNPRVNMFDFLRAFIDGRNNFDITKHPYTSEQIALKSAKDRSPQRLPSNHDKRSRGDNGARAGYVYLFKCADLYKIGFSVNPASRMKAVLNDQVDIIGDLLAAGNQLTCLHTIRVDSMRRAESYLHTKYMHRNHHREWFKLADTDVTWICSQEALKYERLG